MPARLENTIRVSIPQIQTEIDKLPNEGGNYRAQFLLCFQRELGCCVAQALRAIEGQVVFSDLQILSQKNGQYTMNFEVFDRSKPRENAYNFHGQNISQWTYAGCILYQDGKVSTHH